MNYAYELSDYNKDFIYTLKAENGTFDPLRISTTNDWGLCQLNKRYHKDFINSPAFQEWRSQLDYCWKVWQDATVRRRLRTTFYGYNNIGKIKHFFKFNENP